MSTTPDPTMNTHSLEIAVYTVKPSEADAFPARQAAMHAALRSFPGFLGGERLRGLDTPTMFADYILWASRGDAEAAAAQLPALPGANGFVAAIAEMRTFAHLAVAAPSDPSVRAANPAADVGARATDTGSPDGHAGVP